MPFKSKAQSRLMHGVASGDIKGSGVPKKVARDFVGAGHGKSQAKLPDRKSTIDTPMSQVVAPRRN